MSDEIISLTGNGDIALYHLDLSSLESVRQFAREVTSNEKKLNVLVNNAGAAGLPCKKTKDNLGLELQVNYYGHFLLTLLLIGMISNRRYTMHDLAIDFNNFLNYCSSDLLRKSPAARIIHVSSMLHKLGKLHFEDFKYKNNYLDHFQAYSDSKLNIAIFSVELARRLKKGTGKWSSSFAK